MSLGYALRSLLVSECLRTSSRTHAQADNCFYEALTLTEDKT